MSLFNLDMSYFTSTLAICLLQRRLKAAHIVSTQFSGLPTEDLAGLILTVRGQKDSLNPLFFEERSHYATMVSRMIIEYKAAILEVKVLFQPREDVLEEALNAINVSRIVRLVKPL